MENKRSSYQPYSLVVHSATGAVQPYLGGVPYAPESASAAEEDTGLIEAWRFLSRNKGTILLASFAGLIVGFMVGIPMTPIYKAETAVEVLSVNQDFMNTKQTDPTTTNDYSEDVSEEETQAQMLQGGALLNRVVIKLDPSSSSLPHDKPKLAAAGWRHWFHLQEKAELTPRQKLITGAVNTLKVRVAPHTRLLQISANSSEAAFAATFVNTLVQEYTDQAVEARYATTQRTGDWLGKEINEARSSLRHSEDALQEYARSSGLIFTDSEQETNVATEKLQQLQGTLSKATADRIAKESRFDLAKNSPPDSLADVLNDDGLAALSEKLSEASSQLAQLNAIYNPDYSKVKRAKAELEDVQKAFLVKRANVIAKIETDYHQAQRNEMLLAGAYVAQEREVTGQDEKAIQYNILKRDVDSNRQLYDTMLQQMKQASIASALRASNVRVTDPAGVPSVPISPNFKLNSALGMFTGFAVSLGILAFRERSDRTLQMPGDIKQWVELPELGTIPSSATALNRGSYYGPSSTVRIEKQLEPARSGYKADRVELSTHLHKSSLVAEAFRSTLTSILFVGENGSAPKVMLLTSTQPGDGKTTVAANLAIALSEIRSKTLIIDADIRRPSMHRVFDLSNNIGLSDILKGDVSEGDWLGIIQETGVSGLHVLTAGTPSTSAAHLMHSPNFPTFLERAKQLFDMILIDTPPMIQMTDARVVGRLSDAAILVARAGVTTRDALLAAKERFEEDHTRVLGAILNCWDIKRSTGSYYYKQYKRYNATYGAADSGTVPR